jgi:signal transduction histidine kinase
MSIAIGACAASQTKKAPHRSASSAAVPVSWSVPISLFTAIAATQSTSSESHLSEFSRHGIRMDVKGPKGGLRVKLVKGMVVQIVENLVSNSVYWMTIRSQRESSYEPRITVRVETEPLTIRFSDNGRGIAPDHRERVFRAYWSLKEKSKRRGLGLFIAKSNAEDLKGGLSLSDKADPQTGRLHEFVLELPDSAVVQ